MEQNNKASMSQEFIDILGDDTGLHLISSPTGSGKTTEIINALRKYIGDNPQDNRKFIFLGPQKKNLPDFVANDKQAIRIQSQMDCIKNAIEKEVDLKKLPFYNEIKDEILFLQKIIKTGDYQETPELTEKRNKFFKQLHLYINRNTEGIKTQCNNGEDILKKYSQFLAKHKWIEILSPEHHILTKRIITMTYDRFLFPMHCGMGGILDFMNPNQVVNFLKQNHMSDKITIICDELDKLKPIARNRIIKQALKLCIDLQKIIGKISRTDIEENFHSKLRELSLSPKYVSRKENLLNLLNQLFTKYHFNSNIYIDTDAEKKSLGIFESSVYPVVNNITDKIRLHYDEDTNQNRLSEYKEDKDHGIKLDKFISKPQRTIRYFKYNIQYLTSLYRSVKGDLTNDNTFKTILDYYPFDEKEINYFTSIPNIPSFRINNSKRKFKTLHPTGRGFNYIKIINNPNHDDRSLLHTYSLYTNPDILLGNLAENFNIVGLTATGNLYSLENFDYDYLEEVLDDKLHLKHKYIDEYYTWYYDKLFNSYQEKNIKIDAAFAPNYNSSDIEEIDITRWITANTPIKSVISCKVIKNIIEGYRTISNDVNTFEIERFLEITYALSDFLLNPNHHRGLFFTQFAFSKNPKYFLHMQDHIEKLVGTLCQEAGVRKYRVLFFTKGFSLQAFQDNLHNAYAENNEKILIFSAHNSLSTGINLQGKSDNRNDVLINLSGSKLSGDKRFEEKDIDYLYIGSMHYWFIQSALNKNDDDDSDLPTSDYNLEERKIHVLCKIVESLNRQSGIFRDSEEFKIAIQNILNYTPSPSGKIPYIDFTNVLVTNILLDKIFQETGRITRTYRKNPYIKILLSNHFTKLIDEKHIEFYLDHSMTMTPELKAVVQLLDTKNAFSKVHKYWLSTCRQKTSKSYHYMRERLKVFFERQGVSKSKQFAIKLYNSLRGIYFLKHPTTDIITLFTKDEKGFEDFWMSINDMIVSKYTYITSKQKLPEGKAWGQIEITSGTGNEVSMEAAGLNIFMKNPVFRKHFEDNGFATEWKPAKYILNPYSFTIYKGIVGEIIGSIVFQKMLGYKLGNLDESIFEYFDFCLCDMPEVMVDFKHWSLSFVGEKRESLLCHIYEKMSIASANVAFIIRILTDNIDNDIIKFSEGGKYIYSVPGILDSHGNIIPKMRDNIISILVDLQKGSMLNEME